MVLAFLDPPRLPIVPVYLLLPFHVLCTQHLLHSTPQKAENCKYKWVKANLLRQGFFAQMVLRINTTSLNTSGKREKIDRPK